MFEIIDIEQGSEAWRQMRFDHITASDIPVLMGVSPYQSIEGLLDEKINKKSNQENAGKEALFQRGHDLENTARNILTDYSFKPYVLTSKLVPMLMASLDGFDREHNIILEAKYCGKTKIAAIKRGIVPKNHYAQVQTQLLVSGAEYCLYWASDGTNIARQIIKPNKEFFEEIKKVVAWFKDILKEKSDGREQRDDRVFESICESSEGS